ncbi:nicotinamide-nucleotide amidase [Budviciaceae bacterium BWR-B9]|uniref:Nicotinamide-nucleotide amidase n=1 Tax=Limnobaculum allomyrinae TaxID=2791986 RepID=A0ABS1IPH9_9GAMM|nr:MULTISPECIES: nicotinamide-nucleotide amidase [Limnobaculum]MBK5143554.1 nicotinamide-nucleotide amidase [Limnobaculum allomyrinae]MBV7691442.1 nicotinamide-nucleotide amidase [Limnobaculum sp. M2-1]
MLNTRICELSRQIGQRLAVTGQWITCAESCTGGLIAAYFTEIAGSSVYFDRGFVTYSNLAKQQLLGVNQQTLSQWGAVSEQTVREMASGALKAAAADIAISVSGIAGPDGGSAEKPVGTVWFGWANREGLVIARKRRFNGNRHQVRQQAVEYALTVVLEKFI